MLSSALLTLLNARDALASLLEANLALLSGALALALSEASLAFLSAWTALAPLVEAPLMGALALASLESELLP